MSLGSQRAWQVTVLAAAVSLGCGARHPMDGKGSTLYWVVTDSAVDFAGCTDDPTFRGNATQNGFTINGLFAYRLAKDGQTATGQDCTQGTCDPTLGSCPISCSDNSQVYQVAGDELLLSESVSTPVPDLTPVCNENAARQWELTDKGPSLDLSLADTLSLSGDPTNCAQVEQSEKTASTNGKGIQGCVVTYTAKATYTSSP